MYTKLFNVGLRVGSLVTKLGLTLYMGRFLGLTELGTFGLVSSYVAIAIPLLGFRFDYVVTRDIVDSSPYQLARMMRDQTVFYGISYILMAVLLLGGMMLSVHDLNSKVIVYTLALSVLESLATITSGNLVSLKRPVLANTLFFIRAALWVVPVIVLGLTSPAYRNADTVFAWWLAGVSISLLLTACIWRGLPWLEVLKTPVDWAWIGRGARGCLFIWIGAVGLSAAGNIDRFVVEFNLGRNFVGITSFYGSFIVAISALLTSGIFAFGYPHLISYHRQDDRAAFRLTAKKMTWQATISCAVISLAIGAAVPLLGRLFHRPEFAEHAPVLWLMLFGSFIKSASESLYYVLYAMHLDKPIWLGNILLLAVAFLGNALLLPRVGFIGIGYSAVISATFLCLWRIFWVKKTKFL